MWKTAIVQCRLCGAKHIAVYPADILDEYMLECSNCYHMACEPVDNIDEGVNDGFYKRT